MSSWNLHSKHLISHFIPFTIIELFQHPWQWEHTDHAIFITIQKAITKLQNTLEISSASKCTSHSLFSLGIISDFFIACWYLILRKIITSCQIQRMEKSFIYPIKYSSLVPTIKFLFGHIITLSCYVYWQVISFYCQGSHVFRRSILCHLQKPSMCSVTSCSCCYLRTNQMSHNIEESIKITKNREGILFFLKSPKLLMTQGLLQLNDLDSFSVKYWVIMPLMCPINGFLIMQWKMINNFQLLSQIWSGNLIHTYIHTYMHQIYICMYFVSVHISQMR